MKVIALTGLPRSGKDTIAAILVKDYGYTKRAFATPLKQAAAILLNRRLSEMEGEDGFDREAVLPEWGFTTRHFLQYLGTEAMRNYQQDFWIRRMLSAVIGLDRVVITDCRFPNEVDLVHRLGGTVVQVVRPGLKASAHVSDVSVQSDCGILNGGTLNDLIRTTHYIVQDRGWA